MQATTQSDTSHNYEQPFEQALLEKFSRMLATREGMGICEYHRQDAIRLIRQVRTIAKIEPLGQGLDDQRMNTILERILGLIGNVDHSKGNGGNAARLRGELLNDIRTIINAELSRQSNSKLDDK